MSADVGKLVNKKETITENLSSSQYISVFDDLVYSAIKPIAEKAGVFTVQWAFDLLATIGMSPHKRAFSVQLAPEEVAILLGKVASCPPDKRVTYIKQCKLDRAYLMAFINRFLNIANKALAESDPEGLSPERNTERKLALDALGMNAWEVEPAINTVEFYSRVARTFVSRIAEKYLRLVFLRTKAMLSNNNMNISAIDLYANNVMTVVRSIYKYSPEKGTLTNFLILWMRSNNNPRFGHEVNIAYSIPQGKRRELSNNGWEDKTGAVTNIAVNIDDALEVPASPDEDTDHDALLYKTVAMLRDYPSVRFYAAANSFPDTSDKLVNYCDEAQVGIGADIAFEDEVYEMSGREPQDLPFNW